MLKEKLNKKILSIASIVLLIGVISVSAFSYFNNNSNNNESDHSDSDEGFHLHAGFLVYKDGELVDFSGEDYMQIATCNTPGYKPTTIKEKVHLHDNVGIVTHVHSEDVSWSNLFESLEYHITPSEITAAFVNNQPVENILDLKPSNNDSIIIVIGELEDLDSITEQSVPVEFIEEIASRVESCGI
ncbi:MAG: hypothetical protein Q9M91_05150 [Candidatus Dojkabacteria bacterium]|nr:hypothetical protein [Candidatus Dojkabacteria bacterium]MDQ7021192.1 hypothetical protein [Candidatus Dojkabacteria bacterium]